MFTSYVSIVETQAQNTPASPAVPEKKSSNRSLYLWGCIVVVAMMLLSFVGGIFVGGSLGGSGNGQNGDDTTTLVTTVEDSDNDDDTDERFIKVSQPTEGQSLNGKIQLAGEATSSLKELTIKIYDDEWNNIGIAYAGLGNTSDTEEWSTFLHITSSPTTLGGKIRVFPADDGEDSRRLQTITVSFAEQNTPGRLRLFSPLYLQTIAGESVYFKGQMKDFFDATVGLKLNDETGKTLMRDTITASGSNTGQWAQFAKVVEIKGLPRDGGNGTWELCEIDSEGEFGEVILTVPILFQ